jgi:serine protease Do
MNAGIQSGDIITKIDDDEIISFDQFIKKLADYSPDDIISVTVMRQSNKDYTQLKTKVTLESATHD